MQDLIQEALGTLVLGVLEEVLGGTDLHEAPLVHEDYPVGDAPREAHLVGHDDHRHAAASEVDHRFENLVYHLRVQGRGRLIKKHDLGLHGQPTGYGDPLLLTPRKALRVFVGLLGDTDPLEEPHAALVGLLRRDVLDLYGGELDVLGDRHVRIQVELLEDHADLAAQLVEARSSLVELHAVHNELAGGDLLEAVDTPEQRALPRPGRPDDDHDLALVNVEIYILQGLEVPEELVDPAKLYEAHSVYVLPFSRAARKPADGSRIAQRNTATRTAKERRG